MNFPENFWVGAVGALIFGVIGIVLLLLGYTMFRVCTPRVAVEDELTKGNMAVAVVTSVLLAGIAYIIAHVIH